MAKFDFEIHTFELDGERYELRPFGGDYLKEFFEFVRLAQETQSGQTDLQGMSEEEIRENAEDINFEVNPEAFSLAHKLLVEAFKKSEKITDEEALEMFVTQNIQHLIGELIQANIKNV